METDEFARMAGTRAGLQALLLALIQNPETSAAAVKAKEIALSMAAMNDRHMQGNDYEQLLSQAIYDDLVDLFVPVTSAQNAAKDGG